MDTSYFILHKLIIKSLFEAIAFYMVNIFVTCIKKMVLWQS